MPETLLITTTSPSTDTASRNYKVSSRHHCAIPTIGQGFLGGLKQIVGGQIGHTPRCASRRVSSVRLLLQHARDSGPMRCGSPIRELGSRPPRIGTESVLRHCRRHSTRVNNEPSLRAIWGAAVLLGTWFCRTRFRRWLVLRPWRWLDWLRGRNSVTC